MLTGLLVRAQAAAESAPSDETALHHSANAIVEGLLDLDESLSPIRPLGVPIGSVDPLGLASISMPPVIATSFLVPPAQANPELMEQLLKALYQWLQTLTPAQAAAMRAALLPLYIALSELAGGISGAALRQLLYGLRHLIAASRSVGANVGRLLWRWIVNSPTHGRSSILSSRGLPHWTEVVPESCRVSSPVIS